MQPLALVTGAAHRLGKSFALTLARLGYDLILHYHSAEEEAHQTKLEVESVGRKVFLIQADLANPADIERLSTELNFILHNSSFSLSVLVNSAALMPSANIDSLTVKDWDSSLDLNLRAPFLLSRETSKKMTDGGLIVNISDVGAHKVWTRYPSYTVSKAALESLTKTLARAYAPKIRVNAIAPGFVLQSDIVNAEEYDRLISRVPLQRPARSEEITSALEFLIKNEYITGQTIVVDGGYSLV